MIILTVDNSISSIAGLPDSQFKQLRAALSYRVNPQAAYFSGGHRSPIRYLLDKRGFFPTGLLYLVKSTLKKLNVSAVEKDKRLVPVPNRRAFIASLGVTPSPQQTEACLVAKNANRGIVVAPTGYGKSVIIALIIEQLQVNTLIVVPNLTLKRQLTEDLKTAFGPGVAGPLGSPIAVENVDALDLYKPLQGYDCVIIDEFHHSAAKTYRNLNKKTWNTIFYRFGLTATPFRTQDNERLLLESILSKVIYRITFDDAVEQGRIVPVEAYYVDVKPREVQGYTWKQVYSELVVNNPDRNYQILQLLYGLRDEYALCLVKEIKHGENIQALFINPPKFVKGENDDNRQTILEFNLGERKQIIGTTGVVGEGVDTKRCEFVVIAGLRKSKGAFMQQVGRGVRACGSKESCKVILFRDSSHKWTLSHFKAQCKILKEEYGVVPARLTL